MSMSMSVVLVLVLATGASHTVDMDLPAAAADGPAGLAGARVRGGGRRLPIHPLLAGTRVYAGHEAPQPIPRSSGGLNGSRPAVMSRWIPVLADYKRGK